MNVADSIKRMMVAYPGLYPTRIRALATIFDSPDWAWVGGELTLVGEDQYTIPHKPRDAAAMLSQFEGSSERMRAQAAGALLLVLRSNAEQQFTVDHAHLLCLDDSEGFTYTPKVKGLRWQDMPEDVTADWKKAATELAYAVVSFQKANRFTDPEMAARDAQELAATKVRAQQFLDKHYPREISETERESRLAALRVEARALGVELVA